MLDPVTVLTGALPIILIIAAILTALTSFLLSYLYRRAVIRTMGKRAKTQPSPTKTQNITEKSSPKKPPALSFNSLGDSSSTPQSVKVQRLYTGLIKIPKQYTLVIALASAIYVLTIAFLYLTATQIEFTLIRFLYGCLLFSWPIAITLFLLSDVTVRAKSFVVAGYLACAILISTLAAAPNWPLVFGMLLQWLKDGVKAMVILVVFLNRRTRAVAPLIMIFAIFAVAGGVLALIYGLEPMSIYLTSGHWIAGLFLFFSRLFGETAAVPISMFLLSLLGVAIFGVLGWLVSRIIKTLYLNKKISDQSLLLDSIWFFFAVIQSITFAFVQPWMILSGLVAFMNFKIITGIGFALLRKKQIVGDVPQLLMLRVFSLGKRSETLYGRLTRLWRYVGNTLFITGPDLAIATVEPHVFLEYLSGRLSSRFIDSEDTLQQTIAQIDLISDSDGRFRIQDFFCFEDTWKMVLSRLVDESEVVLMDLRSFSAKNAGCKFEIEELVNHIPVERVIFVTDKTTDESFMHQSMVSAWESMSADSPNRISSAKINLFEYTGKRAGEFQELLQAISSAANPI